MRVVQFGEYGGLDRLTPTELPDLVPAAHEAVIEVHACGINRVDILSREGLTPTPVPLPHVSGTEVAGRIIALGSEDSRWQIGDRVLVNPTQSCGTCESCREGRDNMCRSSRIFGVQTWGGYAEQVTARLDQLIAIPDSLACESAAAVAVTGSTAWHMLMDRGDLRLGQDVLIIAAGSGIGVMGVQIAKRAGARVFATAGSADKLEKAKALGADYVFDHSKPDWAAEVRALTGGRGVDMVFEHVGAATWEGSLKALARGGKLVTCGGHSGFDVSINLWNLFVKEHSLIGSFAGTRRNLEHVLSLTASGQIVPVIHQRYALDDVRQAQVDLDERGVFGKLMIIPAQSA